MNQKNKAITSGVILCLGISLPLLMVLFFFPKLSFLYYLTYIGFFLAGFVAFYFSKLLDIKDAISIGTIVGIISFIIYYIILTVSVELLLPLLYSSPSASQAFLMTGNSQGIEHTDISYLLRIWQVSIFAMLCINLSVAGSYSYFLLSSVKQRKTIKKHILFKFDLLVVFFLALIFFQTII
jgi:hypothetical protein